MVIWNPVSIFQETPSYLEKYQGIGIRIEDNVVIGKTVPRILSVRAPKEIVDRCYTNGTTQSDLKIMNSRIEEDGGRK